MEGEGDGHDWPDEERDPDEWVVGEEDVDPEAREEVEVTGDGEYTCAVCGERFVSEAELHKHLYRVGLVE